ncbi:hypothetical protein NP493_42g09063 [Ridgeia piscesae]|uniref:Uncharacterized protein n=1 Tax=Ridgeia piscesae TaxID=27915 RepID=A0AAD9UJM7_RIDPI|nr:hypothetical protein NP493_42g09063 [Ridgeia piscesae]
MVSGCITWCLGVHMVSGCITWCLGVSHVNVLKCQDHQIHIRIKLNVV